MVMKNAENPNSIVIPLVWLCGILSIAATDSTWLSALARLVLPLSTWPNRPMLMFNTGRGGGGEEEEEGMGRGTPTQSSDVAEDILYSPDDTHTTL